MKPLQEEFKEGRKISFGPNFSAPFSLGFPGETWSDELNYLTVPVPGTDLHVLVGMASDFKTYTVVTNNRMTTVDSALMAVALVHEVINGYQAR